MQKNTRWGNAPPFLMKAERLDKYLKDFNANDTGHRYLAIKIMEAYIKKYETPALYLKDTDLNKIVGTQVEGLALGVMFDSQREDLSGPDEEEIKEVFRDFTGHEGTPQSRNDFWTAWLLRESRHCIAGLCNFLKKPLISPEKKQIPANILKQEIQQIEQILTLPMTEIKAWIETTLKWEKRALAEWEEEITTS